MKYACVLTACAAIVVLSGCSPAVRNLAKLGENRRLTQSYVKEQEELFAKLEHDIDNQAIKAGTPLDAIISAYGEPILRQERDYKGRPAQSFLYRHPLKYFSSDLIYLYFDKDSALIGWDKIPASSGHAAE